MKNKRNIQLLSIFLSILLSLNGCTHQNNKEVRPIDYQFEECEYEDSSDDLPIINEDEIKMSEVGKKYIDYFNSLNFSYSHEECYHNSLYLNNLLSNNNELVECDFNLDTDAKVLVDNIKLNTMIFLESHPEYKDPFKEDPVTYKSVLSTCLKDIEINSKNDLKSDYHQINDLKIVLGNNDEFENSGEDPLYTAYYNDDENVIIINNDRLQELIECYNYPYQKYIYYLISHELNHVRQNTCPCNSSYNYPNLNYSDEGYSFLLEASAESELYNVKDFNKLLSQFSYSDERKYEGEILLLNITSRDDINKYYNSIYDVNYESLFSSLNLKTDKERLEFLNILTNIDGLCNRNDLIKTIYPEDMELSYNDVITSVGLNYKKNLMKLSLIHLIENTEENEDFSLIENLVMLDIIKTYIIDKTYTYEDNLDSFKKVYNEEVISDIWYMENVYIKYLSEKYDLSMEKIRKYETEDVKIIINAIKDKVISNNDGEKRISLIVDAMLIKYPYIKPIILSDTSITYNIYDSRVQELNLGS